METPITTPTQTVNHESPVALRQLASALNILADRLEAGDPYQLAGGLTGELVGDTGYRVHGQIDLLIKETTRICPECWGREHVMFSSQQKKFCAKCKIYFDWDLSEGQAPLVTNNRQKG